MMRNIATPLSLEQANAQLTAQLTETRQMLQLLLDNIAISVFWKDRNSVYLGCNRVFAMDAGLEDSAEIVGKTDYDLAWSQAQSDVFRQTDAGVIETGQPQYHIIQHQRASDGRYYWVDTHKLPLLNAVGEVVGVFGIEDKLRLSRDPHEESTETVKVGAWVAQPNTGALVLDTDMQQIFGFKIRKRPFHLDEWLALVDTPYQNWVQQTMREHLSGVSSSYEQRYSITTTTGQTRWLLARGTTTYDSKGKVERITGTVADISVLQQSEEQFRQVERARRNLAEVLRETAELLTDAMRNPNNNPHHNLVALSGMMSENTRLRTAPLFVLTTRETEILRLIAQGRANQDIAQHLHISLHTVKNHVSNMFAKLGVKSRTEALSLAHKQGML